MIIGVPKEIKPCENRVALLPGGAKQFTRRGHQILIEKGAGEGSGFVDQAYIESGATIVEDVAEIWKQADMIMKVKEPVASEYPLIREGQILFTFFHFAANRELTNAIINSKCVAIAYETVESYDRCLPLLVPMSEVAGRLAVQQAAKYLETPFGGCGVLLGGIPGVPPATVLVLGAGIVGVHAAKIASGMGAKTIIMDINMSRLRYLDEVMQKNVFTMYSNEDNICQLLPEVDAVIGAVLKTGAKAPHLITRDMLKVMKPRSVLIDVAIDQGGCFELSRPTNHNDPVFIAEDIVHYCVSNMPGAVPRTSTLGLTNVTLPYAMHLADKGWEKALTDDTALQKGLNIADGKIIYKNVADAFDMDYTPVEQVLRQSEKQSFLA